MGLERTLTDTEPRDPREVVIDLRAALIYDRPTLRRSSAEDAQAFLEILDLKWRRTSELARTPLGAAAVALSEVFSGEGSAGVDRLRELAGTPGDDDQSRLARLLGLALLAWADDDDRQSLIEAAAAEVVAQGDDELAVLYLLKLAGFSLDSGRRAAAQQLVAAAMERVPAERDRMLWRLRQISAWIEGGFLVVEPPEDIDVFADYPWISAQAARSARDALKKLAESRVEDPWRRSIHFGTTPLDSSTAAVLQAEWAGALWHLSDLRMQQAALIIAQGGRDTSEWERAASTWALAGGSKLRDVMRSLEPHFDRGSMRRVVVDRLARGLRLQRQDRYFEVLLALWDLLDDELALEVLRSFRPSSAPTSDRDGVDALWTVIAVLVPQQWTRELQELTDEQRRSLLPHLTRGLVDRLPALAVGLLVETCRAAIRDSLGEAEQHKSEPFEAAAVLLTAPLLEDRERALLLESLAETPGQFQLMLLLQNQDLAEIFDVPLLLAQVLEWMQRDATNARQGRYTMYTRSPVNSAARAAISFPAIEPAGAIIDAIVDLALDPLVMVDFRIDALQALYSVALSHQFDGRIVERTREPVEFKSDPFRPTGDAQFQRALLDCSRFIAGPTGTDVPMVLTYSRDQDPRIRRIAVTAAGEAIESNRTDVAPRGLLLWGTVVGALFDPAPSVVEVGLAIIGQRGKVPADYSGVVAERLLSLSAEGAREVRASITHVVANLTAHDPGSWNELEGLLEQAASDRSWLVRDAARRATAMGQAER